MNDPLADILGDSPPVAPPPAASVGRRARAPIEDAGQRLQQQITLKAAASGRGLEDVGGVQALRRPVTITTLATVFGHDTQTITRRLIECPHVIHASPGGGRKLYDFAEAASYIVKPKMTPEQFVKTLNSAHMPAEINKVFWDGQRSRVKYKIEAQEAWETGDVVAAFGDLCMTLKEGLATLTETLRERGRLTDEQAIVVDEQIDELKAMLVDKLNDLAARTDAPSMFGKPLFGAPGVTPQSGDYADLVEDDGEVE